MSEIGLDTAARVELAVAAHERGERALVAGLLLALPEAEIPTVMARLRLFGFDPGTLLAPARRAHPPHHRQR